MSYLDRQLEIMGISDVPFNTSFIDKAVSILGFGIHKLKDDLGTIDIQSTKTGIDIMFIQRLDGYHYGDPRPISVSFKDGSFFLALIGGRGFHRIYELDERIEAAKKIKELTIAATQEEEKRHQKEAIESQPSIYNQMWS